MKAIRIHETGAADVMRYEDVETPSPGPGQLLVRVEAAGVNFIDTYHRSGQYRVSLPLTLGQEGAGTVVAVGADVTDPGIGTPVTWTGVQGSYAQYALVPADRAVTVPAGLTTRQAAAAMLQGMTAHYLACTTFPLKDGDTCLIHAVAGGVGRLLCQIAGLRGARVIGTASTEAKARVAQAAGAGHVIRYTETDFAQECARLTQHRGVQVVYDSVGRDTFHRSLDCLARRGMLVLFGQSSGAVEAFDPQTLNRKGSLFLTRPSLAHYTATREELLARAADVFGWIQAGKLELRVHDEYPLARAADAHRALEGRHTMGKLLLIPDQ